MVDKLSWILTVFVAVSILWTLYRRGWKLRSPIPENPWYASAYLAIAVILTAKLSWHSPDVRTNLNIIIILMIVPAAVQLYRTLRDSRRSQAPPAWASYGTVCLCCFLVADAVSLVLYK